MTNIAAARALRSPPPGRGRTMWLPDLIPMPTRRPTAAAAGAFEHPMHADGSGKSTIENRQSDDRQGRTDQEAQGGGDGAGSSAQPLADQDGEIDDVRSGHDPPEPKCGGELRFAKPAAAFDEGAMDPGGDSAAEARQAELRKQENSSIRPARCGARASPSAAIDVWPEITLAGHGPSSSMKRRHADRRRAVGRSHAHSIQIRQSRSRPPRKGSGAIFGDVSAVTKNCFPRYIIFCYQIFLVVFLI